MDCTIGAILYDLLTGRPPFKAASIIQTMDLVRQQEPVRPSQLNAAIPRDLETICLKCLRKEVSERYQSAAELADDLEAFLQHRPIRARRVTLLERAFKFYRRSPLLATVLILFPLTIVLGGVGMLVIAERTRQYGEQPEPECPAGMVNWYTAAAYCNWLSQQEGIPTDQWCYQPNAAGKYAEGMRAVDGFLQRTGYRLPTEAEWEFACRAMTTTSRYYGDSEALLAEYAWYSPLAGDRCHPVGQLRPNGFGLFDILGNQYEWCHDVFHSDVYQSPDLTGNDRRPPIVVDDRDDHLTPVRDTDRRVLRGGSFDYSARHSRSAYRTNDLAPDQISNNGFRPACTLNSLDQVNRAN